MQFRIAFVAIGLVLASCQRNNRAGVEVDSKLKGYILPNAKVLAGLSFDKIKKTDFYKRHADQLKFPQLDQLPQQIGLDPRRDLSSFMLEWDGSDTLAMIRGTFSQEEVQKRLSANSVPLERFNKFTLYGDDKRAMALLPRSVALVGSPAVLKKALNEDSTGAGPIPEDVQLQLARLNSDAQVWVVSSGVIPLAQLSMRSDAATALANISDYIDATAVGLTMTGGVALDAHISCISEEGSKRVHDALRGVIGLARLSTQDNQLEQLKIWDSIKVEKQGKEVRVTAGLTPALADKLMGLMPSLSRRF